MVAYGGYWFTTCLLGFRRPCAARSCPIRPRLPRARPRWRGWRSP